MRIRCQTTRWRILATTAVVFALVVVSARGMGQDGLTPSDAHVKQLVEQLDAPDLTRRSAAERSLLEMGPAVLPHLEKLGTPASSAIRDSLQRIREVLQRTQAAESLLPSRVTVNGNYSLVELVEAIEDQTGNRIETDRLPDALKSQELSCDWNQIVFWESMERIDRAVGLAVRFHPELGTLEVVPEELIEARPLFKGYNGAFEITVRGVTLRPDFTDESRSVVRIQYEVAAEPRLRPLFVRVGDADFHLTCRDTTLGDRADSRDRDANAKLLTPNAQREHPARQAGPFPLSVDFVVPRTDVVQQVDFAGHIEVELAAACEEFVFRDLTTEGQIVRRRSGATAILRETRSEELSPDSRSIQIDLQTVYDQGGPAFESHRTWVYHNEAFLRSKEGHDRWFHDGFDTMTETESAVRLRYRFSRVPLTFDEVEFVYVAPALVDTVSLEIDAPGLAVARRESGGLQP